MSAFVKLVTASRTGSYLGIPPEGKDLVKPAVDNMGVLIPATQAEILSGEDKGKMVTEIKANQVVRIRPAVKLSPTRYTVVQGFNPILAELGAVSISPIVQPRGEEIYLVLKAYRTFDLKELDWVFLLYMAN